VIRASVKARTSRGSVYAASMVARTGVVGDRLGLAAGPHPLPAKIVVM
jgi:hypothetical protein